VERGHRFQALVSERLSQRPIELNGLVSQTKIDEGQGDVFQRFRSDAHAATLGKTPLQGDGTLEEQKRAARVILIVAAPSLLVDRVRPYARRALRVGQRVVVLALRFLPLGRVEIVVAELNGDIGEKARLRVLALELLEVTRALGGTRVVH